MNSTDPNQILDNLLGFIDEHSTGRLRPYFTDGELIRLVQELKPDLSGYENPDSGDEILRILNKLTKDNCISFELMPLSKPEAERIKQYQITFEGRLLLKNNGYVGEYADKNFEKVRLRKQDDQIRLLTLLLAIGSIGVLIIEAMKFLFDYFL